MRPYRNKTTLCMGLFFCVPLDQARTKGGDIWLILFLLNGWLLVVSKEYLASRETLVGKSIILTFGCMKSGTVTSQRSAIAA